MPSSRMSMSNTGGVVETAMTADPLDEPPAAPSESAPRAESAAGSIDPTQRVAELESELTSVKDRLLRTLADQENMRRRLQRERDDIVKFAVSGLARDLLPTADNLHRAVASAPEMALDDAARQWLAGIAATERALLDALERHGVQRIDPLGETFDPNRHEAIFEAADGDHPAGTVIEVLQPGYLHHERVLRPAMVGVVKDAGRPA
jgi:molecular chaperone GrpE